MNIATVQPAITMDPSRAFPVVGIITAAHGAVPLPGGGVGYFTANTTYTIVAAIPEHGVMTLEAQVPQIRLWSVRSELQIDAEELVGKAVSGVWVGGTMRWNFYEPPMIGACSSSAPGGVAEVQAGTSGRGSSVVPGPDLPPVDGGTSDSPANPPSAPGGGIE